MPTPQKSSSSRGRPTITPVAAADTSVSACIGHAAVNQELEARVARTAAERDAVYRHRYEVYCEELGRYADRADHAGRRLVDPEDEHSDHVLIEDDGAVVASLRMTWGARGFSARQVTEYDLAPFLAELPAEVLMVGERTMISPSHRGRNLFEPLGAAANACAGSDRALITFGCCEPHLVGYYGRGGMRPYAARNINHPQSGYLVPLICFVRGVEALTDLGPIRGLPGCVADAMTGPATVVFSHLTEPAEYVDIISCALATSTSPLAGLEPADLGELVARSNIITCAAGDRIARVGGTATTVYVVIDGATGCGVTAGGIIGRSAALDLRATDRDVFVAADGTRVVALSEGTLARLPQRSPQAVRALVAAANRHLDPVLV
jgi:hypothetical protein